MDRKDRELEIVKRIDVILQEWMPDCYAWALVALERETEENIEEGNATVVAGGAMAEDMDVAEVLAEAAEQCKAHPDYVLVDEAGTEKRNPCCGCICSRCRQGHNTGPRHTEACVLDAGKRMERSDDDD